MGKINKTKSLNSSGSSYTEFFYKAFRNILLVSIPPQDYYFTLMSLNDDERVVSAQASSFTTKAAMPTAVEQPAEPLLQPRKILRDGRILIEFNGKTYTLTGQRLQ